MSSLWSSNMYAIASAFDRDYDTACHTMCDGKQYIKVDFAQAYVTKVKILNAGILSRLEGATSKLKLKDVGDKLCGGGTIIGAVKEYELVCNGMATSFVLRNTDNCLHVAEIYIYGKLSLTLR